MWTPDLTDLHNVTNNCVNICHNVVCVCLTRIDIYSRFVMCINGYALGEIYINFVWDKCKSLR